MLNEDMEQTSINLNYIAAITIEEASEMVNTVVEKGNTKGFLGAYRYRITQVEEMMVP